VQNKERKKLLYFFALLPRLYVQWRLLIAKIEDSQAKALRYLFLFAGLQKDYTLSADYAKFFKIYMAKCLARGFANQIERKSSGLAD
jgi:hypothetical protein